MNHSDKFNLQNIFLFSLKEREKLYYILSMVLFSTSRIEKIKAKITTDNIKNNSNSKSNFLLIKIISFV